MADSIYVKFDGNKVYEIISGIMRINSQIEVNGEAMVINSETNKEVCVVMNDANELIVKQLK